MLALETIDNPMEIHQKQWTTQWEYKLALATTLSTAFATTISVLVNYHRAKQHLLYL